MGIAAGRAAVPKTCWVSRSSSRNGSVRMSMIRYLLTVTAAVSRSCDLYSMPADYLTTLDSHFILPHNDEDRAATTPEGTVSSMTTGPGGPPPDLYQVLGVGPGASGEEITRAWRQRARAEHPDARPRDAAPA